MKKTIRLTVTSVLALLGALPAKAVAQTAPQAPPVVDQGSTAQTPPPPVVRPRRPYRGLFGGSESGVGANGLGLSVSGFGGYDDNVVADQPGSVGARQPVAGTYGGMITSLDVSGDEGTSRFMAIGGTELRFYEESLAPTSFSQWVDLAATVPLGRRFTFVATHGAAHSPYYQMSFLPGLPSQEFAGEPAIEPFDVDLGVTALETYRYDASLRLQQEINRTSELRYEYTRRATPISKKTSVTRTCNERALATRAVSHDMGRCGSGMGIRKANRDSNRAGDQASSARPRGWILPSVVVLAANDRCLLRRYRYRRIELSASADTVSLATPACITRLDGLGWRARRTSATSDS